MNSKFSRFLGTLVYLYWVPIVWLFLQHPGSWGEKQFTLFAVKVFLSSPKLALGLGLLSVWRPFERHHWFLAVALSGIHFSVALILFCIGYAAIFAIIGIPLGILLFGCVIPGWVLGGWALHLGLAYRAATGRTAMSGQSEVASLGKRLFN